MQLHHESKIIVLVVKQQFTPFNSFQKWSINSKYTSSKPKSAENSNKLLDFVYKDENPSAIYRSGKYYIVVGNFITMTQAVKDHIFYEIDVPKLAPTAPRSFSLHIKF